MSLKLEDLQTTLRNVVKAIPQFDKLDKHIYADDGLQNEAMEDSLKSVGWCVVVSAPIGASTKDQFSAGSNSPAGHGATVLNVLSIISVRTNPRKNTGENAKNIFVCVREIIKAVLSWKPGPGEKGFSLNAERPFEPDFEDIGCFSYDIRFLKTISI